MSKISKDISLDEVARCKDRIPYNFFLDGFCKNDNCMCAWADYSEKDLCQFFLGFEEKQKEEREKFLRDIKEKTKANNV